MSINISKTEQEALESGDSWIDGDIFKGHIPLNKYKSAHLYFPQLTNEEQHFLNTDVWELCNLIDNERIHNEKQIPESIWLYMKSRKFFGLCIPKRYGGLGFSHSLHSKMVEMLASCSIPVAVTGMVPNSLGPGELIYKYGTQEQLDYWLPRLADGTDIPCFALTSTNAGSDAAGSQDAYGIVQKDGSIKAFFEKRYITLAPVATCIGVAFRVFDPNHVWGDKEDLGITVAVLSRDTEGLSIGMKHNPMDVPFENGPILGRDVIIELADIIGGMEGIGKGWKMLVECLGIGRSISLPSLSAGVSKKVLAHTLSFVQRRKQFGTQIANFEGIQAPLAEMTSKTYLISCMRAMTLGALDMGLNPSVLSAICKYHCTEMAREVLMHGMDINAGSAIILGDRNPIARFYQSMPVSITVEGANIMTRSLIIFGQGAMKNHPHVYNLAKSIMTGNKTDITINGLKFGAFVLKSFVTAGWKGWSAGFAGKQFERNLNIYAACFACLTNILLIVEGQGLKKKESISARMGDIFSYLYMGSCVVRERSTHSVGSTNEQYMKQILEYTQADLLYKIQEAFQDLCDNMLIGPIVRLLMFPYGRRFKKPSDKLIGRVVHGVVNNEYLATWLTQEIHVSSHEQDLAKIAVETTNTPKVPTKVGKFKTIKDYDTGWSKGELDEHQHNRQVDLIKIRHDSLKVNHDGNKVMDTELFKNLDYDLRS